MADVLILCCVPCRLASRRAVLLDHALLGPQLMRDEYGPNSKAYATLLRMSAHLLLHVHHEFNAALSGKVLFQVRQCISIASTRFGRS